MRQRPKAFDQRHINIHHCIWLWKGSATSRQIFRKHKPKSSEQNSSGTHHHPADLWLYTLLLHKQPHAEGCKRSAAKTARADSLLGKEGSDWCLRQNQRDYRTVQEECGPGFCSIRQSDLERAHTGKDRLHFHTTRRHFRKLYSHFFCLC